MTLTRLWIILSAWLVGTGWILSACHALNRTGYLVSLAVAVAILWWQKAARLYPVCPAHCWSKFCRRFKRPLPLLFLLIVVVDLAYGLRCRPDNGDTHAYRLPRVFHWLGSGGWHWIHTGDSRMNIAGCDYEWLFAPLILFTRTDRWIFLPNLLAYLLLPGLVFSVLRELRVSSRVAWWWTWILSSGWCYIFQAVSTLTDSIGVIYALAAVAFALRARQSQKSEDVWFSMLAAGLLTGLKQTNLPLLLPWLIAIWPVAGLLLKRPAASLLVAGLAMLVSFVPMAYLDWKYTGNWTGFPKEAAGQMWAWGGHQELASPFWGVIGNIFCLSAQNLLPLIFPMANAWNNAMEHFVQTPLGAHFAQFEVFGHLGRAVSEPTAGIGLGIIVLILISIIGARFLRYSPAAKSLQSVDWWLWLLYLTPWISLLVFMAKVGTYQNARQAAPYYVLLFPVILAGVGQAQLVRARWWQNCALLFMVITLAYLGFMRVRAFVPESLAVRLHETHPNFKMFSILMDYYDAGRSVEAQRNQLEQSIPADEKVVGYATTVSGLEPGLWLPFGQRIVIRVVPGDTREALLKEGVHYVVVEDVAIQAMNQTIEEWRAQYHASPVAEVAFTRNPGTPPSHAYLVRLEPL